MNQDNPYAPPKVTELEEQHGRHWRLYGNSVLVKNGASLPKVDLESGVTEEEAPLRAIRRTQQHLGMQSVISIAGTFAIIYAIKSVFDVSTPVLLIVTFVCSLFFRKIIGVRSGTSSHFTVWIYSEERRYKKFLFRRNLRIAAFILLLIYPISLMFFSSASFLEVDELLVGYGVWLALILILAVWSALSNPAYKLRPTSHGWLRIVPVHEKALAYLRQLETAELALQAATDTPQSRLLRTMYLYRLPLRFLMGKKLRNPWKILLIILMKYLRSPRLERQCYDYTEAENITQQELCPPLAIACEDWLSAHQDWFFLNAERHPSPLGDLHTETAYLATVGLQHCLTITRSWLEKSPQNATNQQCFITWIDDGSKHVSTHDSTFLVLENPQLSARAHGTTEEIYQFHLNHFSAYHIHHPKEISDLLSLLKEHQKKVNLLLEEKKIQSPAVAFSS